MAFQIYILAPGVFAHHPDVPTSALPAPLERLGTKGTVSRDAKTNFVEAAFGLFGVEGTVKDLPVAPVSYLGDTEKPAGSYVLRADPVHLHARRAQLILMSGEDFFPTREEADTLIESLQAAYEDLNWRWEVLAPSRWYLHLEDIPSLETQPLFEVIGRDIDQYLPSGGDAQIWHRHLNEIQMLLHQSPVNKEREAHDAPMINSLWFWGGGSDLPTVSKHWDGVWSDEPLTRGLARIGEASLQPLARKSDVILAAIQPNQRTLVVLGDWLNTWAFREPDRHEAFLVDLAKHWLSPIMDALLENAKASLVLHDPGYARVETSGRDLKKWWRRKSLSNKIF